MTYPVAISFTFTGTASDLRAQIINPSSGATIGGEILAAAFLSTGSNGYILNFTADSASGDTQAVKIYTSGSASAPLFPAFIYSTPGAGGGSNLGPGADHCTLNFTNTTTGFPVADASTWLTSDAGGTDVVAGTLPTDSNGNVTYLLNAGDTYYFWAKKDGVNPVLGQSFVAVAD